MTYGQNNETGDTRETELCKAFSSMSVKIKDTVNLHANDSSASHRTPPSNARP